MAGNGTTGFCPENFFKVSVGIYRSFDSGQAVILHGRAGDKEGFSIKVIPVSKSVLYIVAQTLGVWTTIFLHNAHLAVLYLDTGF